MEELFNKLINLFCTEGSQIFENENKVEGLKHSVTINRTSRLRRKGSVYRAIRLFWHRNHLTKVLLILLLWAVLGLGSYLFYLAKSTNVADLQNSIRSSTLIYDKNGHKVGSLSRHKGTYIELSNISRDVQNAVIATEDRSFYKNNGINYGRFICAILTAGRFGGGSTITQQLAKNAYLSQEKTIIRKAKEFFLALEISKQYSKQEILTMYLNNSYFGNGVWGVEDASRKYFGVSANEVTLGQSAVLAGMLKGPEIYNPMYSIENATNRRNTVLQNMVSVGYIDQETANKTSGQELTGQIVDAYTIHMDYQYPSYFDAVIDEAVECYGLSEEEVVNNGYRIYTALDPTYQDSLQAIYDNKSLFPVSNFDGSRAESGSVVLDPKTGGVRGLVGHVNNDEGFRSFNYATQPARSPGSTIKPIVAYSPAIVAGWETDRELDNTTTTYSDYTVHNHSDMQTAPMIPMYQALADSLNIPAVATVSQLGVSKAIEYAKKFGLEMDEVDKSLGVALGSGITTNPLEMAQAYSVFANDGIMNDAHLIERIENSSGKVIKIHRASVTHVLDRSVTDKMTSMMLGTFSNGTGVYASPRGYSMAGKTGTTETDFNPDFSGDQWIIGYTPDVVISYWMGFPTTDENHYLTGTSSSNASIVFRNIADSILPYTKGTTFREKNIYQDNVIRSTSVHNSQDNNISEGHQNITFLKYIQGEAEGIIQKSRAIVDGSEILRGIHNVWHSLIDFFEIGKDDPVMIDNPVDLSFRDKQNRGIREC